MNWWSDWASQSVLQQALWTFIGVDTAWVDKIPYVEFALNSMVSDATGKSPFELCYGEPVALVIDNLDGMHHCKLA